MHICMRVPVRVRYASARPVNHRLNAPGTADGAALNILITAELSRLIEGLLLNGYSLISIVRNSARIYQFRRIAIGKILFPSSI